MTDDTEILRRRAAELARPLEQPADGRGRTEVLEFKVGGERYAVETRFVREVHPLTSLTRLPGTPPFIAGIVNIRGVIVGVLDFRKLFDLPEQGLTDLHRVILLDSDAMLLGLLADSAMTVRWIHLETLQPGTEMLAGIRREYLMGITPERVVVLDGRRIATDPKIVVDEEV